MPLIDTRVPLIAASYLAQSWSELSTPATAETHRTIAISPYGSTVRGRIAHARSAGLDRELGDVDFRCPGPALAAPERRFGCPLRLGRGLGSGNRLEHARERDRNSARV